LWKKEKKKQSPLAKEEASGESLQRIIGEVHAHGGHAVVTEESGVRHAANEFAFKRREGFT
jgi:hypothetical protein